jgi:hypothetical protein
MPSGEYSHQLSLTPSFAARGDKTEHRRLLKFLDERGAAEIDAVARVDLVRSGGQVGRPVAYLCSDSQIYWTKTRAQTGLAAELIVDRLAATVDVGPPAMIIRIHSFLSTVTGASRAIGTLNLLNVVSSKEFKVAGPMSPGAVPVIDAASWTRTAVFQSWIDVVDAQALLRTTDGHVFSHDHGDTFRNLMSGPPRMVVPEIPGIRLDWSSTREHAFEMVSRIESLQSVDILEAVAGIPDEDRWQGMFDRRLGIGRWLIKRQQLLRGEVTKWTSITA